MIYTKYDILNSAQFLCYIYNNIIQNFLAATFLFDLDPNDLIPAISAVNKRSRRIIIKRLDRFQCQFERDDQSGPHLHQQVQRGEDQQQHSVAKVKYANVPREDDIDVQVGHNRHHASNYQEKNAQDQQRGRKTLGWLLHDDLVEKRAQGEAEEHGGRGVYVERVGEVQSVQANAHCQQTKHDLAFKDRYQSRFPRIDFVAVLEGVGHLVSKQGD